MIIRAGKKDAPTLAALASQLWRDAAPSELEAEFAALADCPDAVCLIQYVDRQPVGFAQCQLRHDYVEGTETSPVAYLEGIFVQEDYRHRGCATALLQECEAWARRLGCSEFASDCELTNAASLRFHLALGFTEVNRVICFKKAL